MTQPQVWEAPGWLQDIIVAILWVLLSPWIILVWILKQIGLWPK